MPPSRKLVVEVVGDASSLERTFTRAGVATSSFGRSTKGAERDLSRISRGALAGSGVFRGLGRSIAFASGGFLAFASAGQFLRSSVDAARDAAVTQRQLAQQLRVSGQAWATYRSQIEDSTSRLSRLSGFNNDELEKSLTTIDRGTGDVTTALRLNALAADIARGRNISLATASIAVGKAAAGSTTSLRRLGIQLPAGATGAEALALATEKFAGQARAGATESDRFAATLHNTEVIVGQALLPVVNRYLRELGDWLEKMDRSGRLQKDANAALHAGESAFTAIGKTIGAVDKVTGSFANTLKIVAGIKLASLVTGWVGSLKTLAIEWGIVQKAATDAAAAEAIAAGGSGAGTGGGNGSGFLTGAALARLLGRGAGSGGGSSLAARVGQYTAEGGAAAAIARMRFFGGPLVLGAGLALSDRQQNLKHRLVKKGDQVFEQFLGPNGQVFWQHQVPIVGDAIITQGLRDIGRGGSVGFLNLFGGRGGGRGSSGPFGGAQRQRVFTQQFDLTPLEQLAQAEASLTKTNQDDVTAARQVVARIKRLIDQGRLKGAALIQALGLEASALSTIWAAEDAAAQARAQKAQAAKARIQQQIENSIDPLRLEVALSRAQALGKPLLPFLKALRAAAEHALATGKLSLEQQKEAYDQIASLNQQIKDAATTATQTFTAPANLQLALAKDQALGRDPTKDLLKLKAAILKFIRTHRKNTQALIDAYNQLAQVNEQLGQSATSAYGMFKQASIKAETAGLGLTPQQRRQLEQRLSQLGPGGTTPATGTGAAGYVIDPATGHPIKMRDARSRYQASHPSAALNVREQIVVKVMLDGKQIASSTTVHQQRYRRSNPSSRRGPNAATARA